MNKENVTNLKDCIEREFIHHVSKRMVERKCIVETAIADNDEQATFYKLQGFDQGVITPNLWVLWR